VLDNILGLRNVQSEYQLILKGIIIVSRSCFSAVAEASPLRIPNGIGTANESDTETRAPPAAVAVWRGGGCGPRETTGAGSTSGGTGAGGAAGGQTFWWGCRRRTRGALAPGHERPDRGGGGEAPGAKVVFADAAQNNAKQVADVENFLQQGSSCSSSSPNEAAPLRTWWRRCTHRESRSSSGPEGERRGRTPCGSAPTTRRSGSGRGSTWRSGPGIRRAQPLPGSWSCAGLKGSTPAKERGDGFRAGINGQPRREDRREPERDWLRREASRLQAMLSARPGRDWLYAHNDPWRKPGSSRQTAGADPGRRFLFVGDRLPWQRRTRDSAR
jgi:hypothetical protein